MRGEVLAATVLVVHFAVVAIWDLHARRIPNPVTASLALSGLAVAAMEASPCGLGVGMSALSAAVAFALLLGLRRMASAVNPHATIGGGDIKLVAATAAWTGLPCIVLATVLASAALLAVAWLRRMGRHDRLPFGPPFALAVSVLLALAPGHGL